MAGPDLQTEDIEVERTRCVSKLPVVRCEVDVLQLRAYLQRGREVDCVKRGDVHWEWVSGTHKNRRRHVDEAKPLDSIQDRLATFGHRLIVNRTHLAVSLDRP